MARLVIKLQRDRDRCGSLTLYDARGRRICGPLAVSGRSSDSWAAANGNPERNPLLRFGDTPTGGYKIRRILKSGSRTPYDAVQFGPNGVVLLEGVTGDAALAEANGRFHFLIVGGKLSANGELRSTAGSLRVSDEGQKSLVSALRKQRNVVCEIAEDRSVKLSQRVYVDPNCKDEDPHSVSVDRERSAARPTYQDLLLGGAAGAMILEVAFVALPVAPAHASQAPSTQNLPHLRDDVKFLPPKARRDPGYVRLAYGAPGVTAPSTPSTSGSNTDRVIQQQREINAINSEKPPPNATQDQLKQWQQNQQQRIQEIMNPPQPPANNPPPKG